MSVQYTFRALTAWPYAPTPAYKRRGRYTFKAGWDDTLGLLSREMRLLKADQPVIAAGFREQDLRLDGLPRSNAREPSHPGVEISFTAFAVEGRPRLVYATDVCERWEHNVRSIALGLESLRAVDRYGITRRGEQYAGWRQLTDGGAAQASRERGMALVREYGSVNAALRATHPDTGGDTASAVDFQSVQMARGAA